VLNATAGKAAGAALDSSGAAIANQSVQSAEEVAAAKAQLKK
jgi:hypothetical protein